MSDDWCYVDSESGSVRSPSFDLVEPEFELEPMYVEEPIVLPKTLATPVKDGRDDEEEALDVTMLLSDSNSKPTCFSRALRLSLLSPAHHRYVVTGAMASPKTTSAPRKRSVREAFTAPSRREHADAGFVGRVRAAMPSRRGDSMACEASETTLVKPFTCDVAVQTDEQELIQSDCVSALTSALDRSLRLSVELTAKAQSVERLDVRGILLQCQNSDLQQQNEKLTKQLRTAERGLRISKKRSELAEEYQDHLKRGLEQLRSENDSLHQRIEVLAGGLDVEAKTIAELEQLEDTLETAMTKVRGALRAKYRAAIGGTSSSVPVAQAVRKVSDDGCVVCMERLPCVRLEPCGHEVLCSACAVRVSECPIDREQIIDKVLTHGLTAYARDE